MRSFNYFFGILLGAWIFAHTDNLSATLQSKKMSAVVGQRLANQTIETLKRIRTDESFNAFYESVLEKKKKIAKVGEPLLKGKGQAPARFFFGKTPAEHPTTAKDHYRKVYFEAVDLVASHTKDRFNQPSFLIFQRLESLLIDSLSNEIEVLEDEIAFIGNIYDEIDILSLSC